jgi:DsbC/DsbD-like thiol-disulfide interchange protein/cytochrome c biogenesis protein CcdA/thiol-disulfide isomerase/thioredoxin
MQPDWHEARMYPVMQNFRNMICAVVTLLLLAFAVPSAAQLPGAPLNVPAQLRAETVSPAPGKAVTLAFVMTPKSTWHGYWVNGGDAGLGMQLTWQLPKGVTAGELRYPVPKPLIISGLMNYVYERPYALLADLRIDPAIRAGTKLPIKVRADWLACTDRICVPEGDDLTLDLIAGQGIVLAAERTAFDGYRAALPVPLDRKARFAVAGKFLEIAVPFAASAMVDRPYFFAVTPDAVDYPVAQTARRVGDNLIIRTGYRGANVDAISGVLRYGNDSDGNAQGVIVSAVPGPIPAGGTVITALDNAGAAAQESSGQVNFALVLLFAVLGGLILNLMPCVFPILGLKALSLAKLGGDERSAKRDALAYTGGVMLSTIALGGLMLALRAGGMQVGWAFQLQEPRVVMLLLLLMTAVTINLFGLFELATVNIGDGMTRKAGAAGSFWTGVLASVVATPCTGPFMAAALGAALLMPAAGAMAVFAGLGFGLALPYLLMGFVPGLRQLLPKPGPWLSKFRTAMGVPMALTATALLWLLWRLSGQAGLILGGAAAATIAVFLILVGNAQRRSGMTPPIMAATILALTAMAIISLPREANVSASKGNRVVTSEPYSEGLLAKYRGTGAPVFVNFTADWCVTCKINEASAIQRDDVAEAFKRAGVKTLEGDFTRRVPDLARALASHGRSGVPLYLFYQKGAEAEVLPQIITADDLISRARASGKK